MEYANQATEPPEDGFLSSIESITQDHSPYWGVGTAPSDQIINALAAGLATKLDMRPDSIERWLEDFATTIRDVNDCRDKLQRQSFNIKSDVKLGSFEPGQQLKDKMIQRVGDDAGGLAWAVNSVVIGLTRIHEKLRLSLQTNLNTDFSNAQAFGKLGDRTIVYHADDAANS